MAILDASIVTGTCPKCGSEDTEIVYRKIESTKSSVIAKKCTKCNTCGFEG
jgi:predicted RNA-binding Zn-ribbon protein involved in translation (DUF1610 family)